ncbi:MAG: polysaccharide deacetylase family protein [Muribaculaceae bacterium]|nr:polysaccharide deacetylase family protein [Muribaculaceae bacterium]MDE7392974.1 polysaccharide deacetylase family protein [Muribaculaceae bacterium]
MIGGRLGKWISERPRWFHRAAIPGAVWRLKPTDATPGRKVAWLTFDDGPIPDVTPAVLDILDAHGVKATFFMVGDNVERHPELLSMVKQRGHAVGNHTLHHTRGYRCRHRRYVDEATRGRQMMATNLFRPPHGFILPWQLFAISRHDMIVMHDVVSMDYDATQSCEEIIERVKRLTRNGSIIVFHDSLKAWPRLKSVLPEIISWLKQQDYELRAIKR